MVAVLNLLLKLLYLPQGPVAEVSEVAMEGTGVVEALETVVEASEVAGAEASEVDMEVIGVEEASVTAEVEVSEEVEMTLVEGSGTNVIHILQTHIH